MLAIFRGGLALLGHFPLPRLTNKSDSESGTHMLRGAICYREGAVVSRFVVSGSRPGHIRVATRPTFVMLETRHVSLNPEPGSRLALYLSSFMSAVFQGCPHTSTLNPRPSTLNHNPLTLNPEPKILNTEPYTRSP